MPRTTTNWGNYPKIVGRHSSYYPARSLPPQSFIPRGNGRSYGDASLGAYMLRTTAHQRFLHFDKQKGMLTAESGVSFQTVLATFAPRGWWPMVSPGTKFATLGGGVAADVHGKNHHQKGSLGKHIQAFQLRLVDGSRLICSPTEHADIYWATVGGMGLTGMVEHLTLGMRRIPSSYLQARYVANTGLADLLTSFDQEMNQPYLVAWIDCLSSGKQTARSILSVGDWAEVGDLPLSHQAHPFHMDSPQAQTIPFSFPSFTLNPLTIRLFNAVYYGHYQRKRTVQLVDYEQFFMPLDRLHRWNRIYGRRGFVQYQLVVPLVAAHAALSAVLDLVRTEGKGSFLAVLKRLGPGNPGLLSFPMEGYTLTLDMPIYRGLWTFLDQLDERVVHYGGRVYLAKDARLSPEIFRKMYPAWEAFQEVLEKVDPERKLHSHMSERLAIRDA